jgi:RNAse (barnase) inhibitor barstar
VFSIGKTLIKPIGEISNHAAINLNGYGQGITLENLNHYKINYNQINLNSEVAVESAVYTGISLENTGISSLYGNSITANGAFPALHAFHLAGAQNNKLCCNSTDGGSTGLYFLGTCHSTKLRNTQIGSHNIGLQCENGSIIGTQEHTGNVWNGGYATFGAEHLGNEENIEASRFSVAPGYLPPSIYPDPAQTGITWFRELDGFTPSCTDEENTDCFPAPQLDPFGGKESDQKVAEGDYGTGDYAVVHNWEAGLELFARLKQNETLRNSETWYLSFYAQNDGSTIGDYTKVHEQFQALLSLSDEERQNADALWESIEEGLKKLKDIGVEFNQATTEADSLALEADWLEKYADMGKYFANWRQLSDDVRQRMEGGIPELQAVNAALPEDIVPAANEKLMNAIQLQRILGEPLTEKQQAELTALAFSCPLEAGNAVYRARTMLRTQGNFVFDDIDLCGLGKEKPEEEGDGKKNLIPDTGIISTSTQGEWRIYPNPAQKQVWLEGPMEASLAKIRLYNHLGRLVLTAQGAGNNKQEMVLTEILPAGIYFLVLELADGSRQTRKLIIEP